MRTFQPVEAQVVQFFSPHRLAATCGKVRLSNMKRSFQSLSPQEALHVAAFIEERNSELYHQFAEMFASFQDLASLEIAGVLWEMAAEERDHGTRLQERYTAQYGLAACALTEADIVETIELPQLNDQEIFDSSSTAPGAAHGRALKVALEAENQARNFYAELAATTDNPETRALYAELSSLEAGHVEFIERRLSKSTPHG
jgi:rubrerythrin